MLSLFRLIGIDRYCFTFLDIDLESRSDSNSVASRTVVNDKPLSMKEEKNSIRSDGCFLGIELSKRSVADNHKKVRYNGIHMQNKPFIVLFRLAALVGNVAGAAGDFFDNKLSAESNLILGKSLFPCIPNSSVESRSSESNAERLYGCWITCA